MISLGSKVPGHRLRAGHHMRHTQILQKRRQHLFRVLQRSTDVEVPLKKTKHTQHTTHKLYITSILLRFNIYRNFFFYIKYLYIYIYRYYGHFCWAYSTLVYLAKGYPTWLSKASRKLKELFQSCFRPHSICSIGFFRHVFLNHCTPVGINNISVKTKITKQTKPTRNKNQKPS